MDRIGILLNSLENSQLTFYLVNNANFMMESKLDSYFIFFIDNIGPSILQPLCPIMNSGEVAQFNNGIIIATTINHTLTAINSISNSKIKFYVWDLEWIRKPSDFFNNIKAFRDPRVEVIARSYDHAKAIANYANIPTPRVVEYCNISEIIYDKIQ